MQMMYFTTLFLCSQCQRDAAPTCAVMDVKQVAQGLQSEADRRIDAENKRYKRFLSQDQCFRQHRRAYSESKTFVP